ncbi:MAG: HDIG domain-containing protein, partial [Firmicutes bacterium]|nr:HDIG domain-containing protein [Bacillota bacterium]
ASYDVGIHNIHPELIKLLGRLKYRTSYGQNVLKHSEEVSHLAGLMAGELGMDVRLAKRAGLLHDIGKAIDHDKEGTHVDLGIEVLKKYKESQAVIDAMAAHHGDYEAKTPEAVLIAAADALSAARPGARRETLETYVKRLQQLEEIANNIKGVDKSFAIQAGREIRVIAQPDKVTDAEMPMLAREIAKKVEEELDYPGQIKVNIVRETRAVDYAK